MSIKKNISYQTEIYIMLVADVLTAWGKPIAQPTDLVRLKLTTISIYSTIEKLFHIGLVGSQSQVKQLDFKFWHFLLLSCSFWHIICQE